jgi:hypothetical protein
VVSATGLEVPRGVAVGSKLEILWFSVVRPPLTPRVVVTEIDPTFSLFDHHDKNRRGNQQNRSGIPAIASVLIMHK